MNKMFTEELKRRAFALKIPKSISQDILTEANVWLEKSGVEWSVKRLKALKTDFIRIVAGQDRSSEWIRYCNGVPFGAFGKLFRWGLRDSQNTAKTLQVLAMYTVFLSEKDLPSQLSKFYESVATDPLKPGVVEEFYASHILPLAEKLTVGSYRLHTVKDFIPSTTLNAPTVRGRTIREVFTAKQAKSNIPLSEQKEGWLGTIDVLWDTSLGRLLYSKYPQVREVVKPLEHLVQGKLRKLPPYFYEEGYTADIRKEGFVGKIGHIQEPGLKLRAVANPFRVYQLALSRLGMQLYELLTSISWDNTHDQENGVAWAQRKLQAGNTMFAVDLSDATNVFPLSLQLLTLKSIKGIVKEDINLFEDLSSANWLTPSRELVKWTKGQPLGLFPSFASFALTHGLLLRSLEIELGLLEGDNFQVLGDDVVISDPALHTRYREVLEMLEVGVSDSKTIISDRITEFGGRVISRDSIISLGKWREVSDRSFIDTIKNVGPRYIKYLRPRQRRVIESIITLPSPWGLNMNPAGIGALERHYLLEDFILGKSDMDYPKYQKDDWTRTVMLSQLASPKFSPIPLNEVIHSSGYKASVRQDTSSTEDLLVRIHNATGVDIQPSTQLASWERGIVDKLERMRSIARSLGLVTERMGDPRGSTTLEILEKRIKRVKSTKV